LFAATHEDQFAALRAEVNAAHLRRRFWSLLGASLFLAATLGAAALLAPFVPAIAVAVFGG
jgi:hypothetical protein